jgi:hypothetical protein
MQAQGIVGAGQVNPDLSVKKIAEKVEDYNPVGQVTSPKQAIQDAKKSPRG